VWFTLHVSHTKITIFREEATSTLAGFHVQCRFSILIKLEFEDDGFFAEGGKLEKNLCSKARTNNKHSSHNMSPGQHQTALVEGKFSHHMHHPYSPSLVR